MTQFLQIDEAQIKRFHNGLFRYADDNTWLSSRAFFDDGNGVFETQGIIANKGDNTLEGITSAAERATRSQRATVFCPPIATFNNPRTATEKNLANGLALSVECDQYPKAAQQKLVSILGSATIVVASGGEWLNSETGEVEDKLHLHWRLNEPTRDAESHTLLKKARTMATALVGGDASNKPIVHPIRWPGSWHRKGTPRLATIVSDADCELDLHEAIERLSESLMATGGGINSGDAKSEGTTDTGTGESRETAALVSEIISGRDYHSPISTLAMRYLLGGMPDQQVVLTLRGIMQSVPPDLRDLKDGSTIQTGRWQARYDDISRAVSTARNKLGQSGADNNKDIDLGAWNADRYSGEPPPIAWLVEGTIPTAVPVMIAAMGDTGKSYLLLDLCLRVATHEV